MTQRIPALATVLVLLAAPLLAACGSGSDSANASAGSTTAATQPHTSAATVKTASVGGLGTILVDSQGRTIYLFQRDTGPHSTCSGQCLANWPAVTTHGKPQAAGDVEAAKLGTTRRSDGTMQATYSGHPLYYYAGDGTAGDTNGQAIDAFGAEWYVLGTNGAAITSARGGGDSTGSSGGYGY